VAIRILFGLILLLDGVVDRLRDDLAVLDQVGIGAVGDRDVGVFLRPFQERHPSFGHLVGVLERAVFGQLLAERLCQLHDA
jgi:hypothetical protein